MDCKRVGTIHSINNAWAQELLMCSDGFSSFAKEMRPLKMRRAVTSQWKLTTTTWEQLKLLKNSMPTALCLSGIWNKLERWKSSRNRFLMSWLQIKKSSFCHRLLFCATANHFLIGLWHAMESEFHTTTGNDQSVAGPRGNSKALPKAKLATKKSLFGGPLLIWSTTVSESWENHYMWEVCSENQRDAPKATTPAAIICQQKGPNSSPRQCLTACHTTNASKVEWIGLWSFTSPAIIHLTSHQPTTTSSSLSTTFCRENTSITSRRQKMLSKSLLNPEVWVFTL